MERKFDQSDWRKIALDLDEEDTILEHSRLLRSLQWGDPDYGANVIDVLSDIGRRNFGNLLEIAEYVDFENWLSSHNAKLYKIIFVEEADLGKENPLDEEQYDVGRQIQRIYASIDKDPELAIGSTKELLETVMKTIINRSDVDDLDIPQLLKVVQKKLDLLPGEVDKSAKGADIIKRTLSNLGLIVIGVTELRNLYGTGHGKVKNISGVEPYHARLVVNAGITLAKFLIEVNEHQSQ